MPREKDFKRLVRRRMRRTGESYAAARAHLGGRPRTPGDATRDGGGGGRAFDRLTERAKAALAIAEEAALATSGSIGTEHLLLGLLRERGGSAAWLLRRLGADVESLERDLTLAPADPSLRPERAVATAGVARAVELAFGEAALMGDRQVGSEHLLLGLLAEGLSPGAQALAGAGVVFDRARNYVRHHLGELAVARAPLGSRMPARQPAPPNSPEVAWVLGDALRRSVEEGALAVRLDHLLQAICGQPDGFALLRAAGADPASLRRLAPPARLVELQRTVRDLTTRREEAVAAPDRRVADDLQDAEREARRALERAQREWVRSVWIGRPT